MAGYQVQGELFRSWRMVAGLSQPQVADRLGVRVPTVSQWETAANGITFESLDALDACYGAAGALSDMAQALGTPYALPGRRSWTRYPPATGGVGWAWLQPAAAGRIEATLWWGPIPLALSVTAGDRGVVLQFPWSEPDVVIGVELSEPGWVDFGRGTVPSRLGIPVVHVPASPHLSVGDLGPGLVVPLLARRVRADAGLAGALDEFFGLRPEVMRSACAGAESGAGAPPGDPVPLVVQRPYRLDDALGFTGKQYRTLRNGRCLTQHDAAERSAGLSPRMEIDDEAVRRLEDGANTRSPALRSRLDVVYTAGGHTCDERTPVRGYRSPFVVEIPDYWVGPVWFTFDSGGTSLIEGEIRRGGARRRFRMVPGASVVSARWTRDPSPFVIECPYGCTVKAGMGARPGAPGIDLPPPVAAPRTPGPGGLVHPHLLSLLTQTPDTLADFLRGTV